MPAPLGPQRSRLADDPAPVARWRVDFTTSDVRPRALATLPEGLTLTRASTATFATSSTTTDSAAANEACLSRSTDYPASQGLLVRPASGGRAADRLAVAASAVLDHGRLALEVTLLPAYSPTGYGYSPRLWTTDAGDYAEIDHGTGRLVVSIAGDSWSPTAALAWTAGQAVTLRVEAGGGTEYSGASYAVAGGAPVDLGTSTSVQAALAPTTIDLLCSGTSRAFEGTVRVLSAWTQAQSAAAPGFSPADLSPIGWWDADDLAGGEGDTIATWPAHSGLGVDAYTDEADAATLHLAALNGHNTLDLDAVGGATIDPYGLSVPAVCTIYVVWHNLAAATNAMLAEHQPGFTGPTARFGIDGSGHLYATGTATVTASGSAFTSAAAWAGVVFDGASSRVRARTGGTTVEGTGDTGTAPSGTELVFGYEFTIGHPWTADVAALLVFDYALDSTQRADLEAWLTTRYGL